MGEAKAFALGIMRLWSWHLGYLPLELKRQDGVCVGGGGMGGVDRALRNGRGR